MKRGAVIKGISAGLAAALMVGTAAADGLAPPESDATLLRAAEQAVVATLKDPDSVNFRGVVVHHQKAQAIVCGEFNAKNSYGGYAGFEQFMYWNGHLFSAELLRLVPSMWAGGCGDS